MHPQRTDAKGEMTMRHRKESGTSLTTCSLCLRVLRGFEWVEAERVIDEIRSYELEAPPRLRAALCEGCADSISRRRARVRQPVAA
jgi:hypothetical protein